MCRAGERHCKENAHKRRSRQREYYARKNAAGGVSVPAGSPRGGGGGGDKVQPPEHIVEVQVSWQRHEIVIPAGHLHLNEVKEREGWDGLQVQGILGDVEQRLAEVPENVSPRIYRLVDVEAAEQTSEAYLSARSEREEKDAKEAAARAFIVPSNPDPKFYTAENTIARAALIERGWTDSHIKRLLAHPDFEGRGGKWAPSYRYGAERVEQAEATDERLRARLAKVAPQVAAKEAERAAQRRAESEALAKQRAEREAQWARERRARKAEQAQEEAAREAALNAAAREQILYRKDPVHGWCIDGADLEVGQWVTVAKRDGTTDEVQATRIISDTNGVRRASFRRRSEYDPTSKGGRVALWPSSIAPRAGQTFRRNGEYLTCVRSFGGRRIDSEDPSVQGEQVLGYEGDRGVYIETRAATEDETTPLIEQRRLDEEQAAAAAAFHSAHSLALKEVMNQTRSLGEGERIDTPKGCEVHIIQSLAPGWDEGDVRRASIIRDDLVLIQQSGSMPGTYVVDGPNAAQLVRAASIPPEHQGKPFTP